MSRELKGIYTIWLREVTKFSRERILFVSALVTPMLWLVIFGGGMGVSLRSGLITSEYKSFIFPGIVGMTLLFSSIRSGFSIIWDREFGFLKEILVAPISRVSVVLGKALGGATTALIQGVILLFLSFISGIYLAPGQLVILLPLMFLISIGFNAFGLAMASLIKNFDGFQTVMSFVNMPVFFLSGALFPLESYPGWLKTISLMDPLTYGVDAMRKVILNEGIFPFYYDLSVLLAFAGTMLIITSVLFSIKK
ncbi:MAG: ABC transporter permease [Candidatus Altiarchaeia archaeon]